MTLKENKITQKVPSKVDKTLKTRMARRKRKKKRIKRKVRKIITIKSYRKKSRINLTLSGSLHPS